MSSENWAPKGSVNQLRQNVSNMDINAGQAEEWATVSKKNRNKGGNAAKQWVPQGSAPTPAPAPAPRAWGQADTAHRLGIRANTGSGPASGRGMGRGGRPQVVAAPQTAHPGHGMNWAARVGSSHVRAAQDDEKDRYSDPDVASEGEGEEEDELSDVEDDEISGGSDSDESLDFETVRNHKLLKRFFEDLEKLPLDEVNDQTRRWHCPACKGGPGAIEWYRGLQPLANHAKNKRSKRVKLHRLFGQLMEEELRKRGTSVVPAGETFGKWDGLFKDTKDREIVWPPMVMVMNTRLEKGDDDRWTGMGNQELVEYFSEYSPLKARHSYGPQGHRGISLLVFETTAIGYLEAERLHKNFLLERSGRDAWEQPHPKLFSYGGRRQLYGCLATKDDIENFNRHCQGKQRMRYEMRSYHEMVVSQMKQMSEDNQQLIWFKDKVVKEKRHSKALEETLTIMSQKLKKTSDENRIVKQRSKMHHEQSQEEMDFQDRFFRDQMKQIQEGLSAKEDNFEQVQQNIRKKAEELSSNVSNTQLRAKEVESFVKSQEQEMSQFIKERDELEKEIEKEKDELKKRYMEGLLEVEKKLDAGLTRLMEKYTPRSAIGA